jgi:hypothetical protein
VILLTSASWVASIIGGSLQRPASMFLQSVFKYKSLETIQHWFFWQIQTIYVVAGTTSGIFWLCPHSFIWFVPLSLYNLWICIEI